MGKSQDDLILEVATDLELTVRGGDFLNVGLRLINFPERFRKYKWEFEIDREGEALKDGDPVQIRLEIPVPTVLGGRNVKPQDVVGLLDQEEWRTRTVSLSKDGQKFILTQKFTYGQDFERRRLKLIKWIQTD